MLGGPQGPPFPLGRISPPLKYSFGAFEFDVRAAELKRRGEPLAVRPKVLELLRALIEERHRPLSKEELLERVWSDAHVGHSALSTTLGELRRALEDTGKRQSVIRTVRGRGYRFVGAVRGEGRDAMASRAADTRPVDFVGRERTLARLGETLESVEAVPVVVKSLIFE